MDNLALIKKISELLNKKGKLNRKQIYENLLAKGEVQPGTNQILNQILDYAISEGFIAQSKIHRYRSKRGKLPEPFTIDQIIKIFDFCLRPKLAIVMWMGMFCGLRISEVCNLKKENIDLKNKKIIIKNSKNTNRSLEGYGKDRVVPLPDIAIPCIEKWLRIVEGSIWFIPSMQSDNKPIRSKTIHEQYRHLLNGGNLSQIEYTTSYKAINHGVKKELKKSTYKYRFHSLRHTYATYLVEKDVPIQNIQKALGHEQIETTLVYAKIRDKKTSKFINDAFNMPMKIVNRESMLNHPPYELASDKNKSEVTPESEFNILRRRLAKGEIDILTFKRILSELDPEKTMNIIITKKEEL